MGIKSAVKKVKQYVTDKVTEYSDAKTEDKELMKCKSLLEKAMAEHQAFRANAAAWDEQYNGTHAVGKNIGGNSFVSNRYQTDQNTPNVTPKDARQVVNITGQLIESQIDITVPEPAVEAIEGDDAGERQKMIEGKLIYMSKGADMMRINSENERIVKKNSIAVFKVMYDPKHKEHKYIGLVKTTNPHPTNVIPQPGQYRVKDMDRMWHIENRTVDQIVRSYGEQYNEDTGRDLRQDIEEGGSREFNYLEDFSATQETTDKVQEKYSVVEQYYKDDDGDIGIYSWCGMVKLRKVDKFFYKRDENGKIMEFEEVEMQIPVTDPTTGQPAMGQNGQPQMKTQTVKVKCHVPTSFPFIIQYNIPKEKTYYGKSDPEMIWDQQEGIKKMLSIEEEKLIKGTTKILTRKGSKLKDLMNNSVSQIMESDNPQADVNVIQMHTNEQSYKDLYAIYTQAAKDMLGVTDASQGNISGQLSGEAINSLANYSHGRTSIKQFEKDIAYTELYRTWYDFALAYYDEKRPYRVDGPENKPIFGYFDKSKLVKQDDAGQWYYPPFEIMIRTDTGLPKDKKFVVETANKAGERMDNIEYWMVMDSVGFPNAGAILDREREKEKTAQGAPRDMPSLSMPLKDMPIQAKIQALAQVGIKVDASAFQSDPSFQPPQQQPNEPIDPHTPAVELTNMHMNHMTAQEKLQHEKEMLMLKHQSEMEKLDKQQANVLQQKAVDGLINTQLNEQKAQHAVAAVKDKPKVGDNRERKPIR